MNKLTNLLTKIKKKGAIIGVIGLGYVGLPLAVLMAKKGFRVIGFIPTQEKVNKLNQGENYLQDLKIEKELKRVVKKGFLKAKKINSRNLEECDAFFICVPTPIDENKKPDLSALKSVAGYLKKINLFGKLIINESSVAPFTTQRILGNLGENYFLACSPERIDPGNKTKTVENIPKVIGGINRESLLLTKTLYKQSLKGKIIEVSSLEAAEMTKMLENTYRAVNIALINEFAILCENCALDILEVVKAAKSKWSFQAHYPGIGVGGHCIPVDPYYLLELARKKRMRMKVVADSLKLNEMMPQYLAKNFFKDYQKGMKVLVYGLSYKKDVRDLRESPVVIFCKLLKAKGVDFKVYSPFLSDKEIKKLGFNPGRLGKVDVFVVGTDHHFLKKDYPLAIGRETLVLDGRNFFKKKVGKKVIGVGRSLA